MILDSSSWSQQSCTVCIRYNKSFISCETSISWISSSVLTNSSVTAAQDTSNVKNRLQNDKVIMQFFFATWASEGFFPEGPLRIFPKFFYWGKSGEICFFPLETKKTTFLLKIQNAGGPGSPAPLPTPM